MSRNGHPLVEVPLGLGALAVTGFEMAVGDRAEWHSHPVHQLTWIEHGVLAASVGTKTWILPSTRALWIPCGVVHAVEASRPATMRSVYARKRRCPIHWKEPTVITVTPLIRELILHLAQSILEPAQRRRVEHVLFDVLEPQAFTPIELTVPADERARRVAHALAANPADNRTLAAFGRAAGASARTLARLFVMETGTTFGDWRMQLRLRAALVHLAEGDAVSVAAGKVGYESTSAFVAAFHRRLGVPPGAYFSRRS